MAHCYRLEVWSGFDIVSDWCDNDHKADNISQY